MNQLKAFILFLSYLKAFIHYNACPASLLKAWWRGFCESCILFKTWWNTFLTLFVWCRLNWPNHLNVIFLFFSLSLYNVWFYHYIFCMHRSRSVVWIYCSSQFFFLSWLWLLKRQGFYASLVLFSKCDWPYPV